jgi:hypothetical protein
MLTEKGKPTAYGRVQLRVQHAQFFGREYRKQTYSYIAYFV